MNTVNWGKASFTDDGKYILVYSRAVKVFDVDSRTFVRTVHSGGGLQQKLVSSLDGKKALVEWWQYPSGHGEKSGYLFSIESGEELLALTEPVIGFSPDSHCVCGLDPKHESATIWSADTGEVLRKIKAGRLRSS